MKQSGEAEGRRTERQIEEVPNPLDHQVMSMAACDPGQRLSEEQDYVQAYENVREKYKASFAYWGIAVERAPRGETVGPWWTGTGPTGPTGRPASQAAHHKDSSDCVWVNT
ncbi:hypothetical protein EYF80_032274 [Liparis tanakae]|uniref:Uncharacterized protein n=1 Tax=Liparis tanakae TaxID=230148 RepID=A0A4Z2GW36_9TELE|nr:hypothetical protein EYF80_032274 [Liparis tanakae]